ncbi:hypothetical protein Thein_1507 [Thermodesulfatator indicus DSM 15286]|uniref:Uncharacterized protein n=1 Tax=Thermodesulfatator indicus (strain DSM 15286 / JCM 11887 / CIR29812) TaxID=667014 RepID=F8AAE8_THEID|nr:hypothetical protein Thein_1507 [Thermodesulfatator indicus DSM 15286]
MAVIHTWRTKDGTKTGRLTPLKAIQAKCLDCSCWSQREVRLCPVKLCPLWPFRTEKIYAQFLEQEGRVSDEPSK